MSAEPILASAAPVWLMTSPVMSNSRDPEEIIAVELTTDERHLLRTGLLEWGGSPTCIPPLAQAMGFSNPEDLWETGLRILDDIDARRPMSRRDWTRALVATEVIFASSVLGCGSIWKDIACIEDDVTLGLLRSVQKKLLYVYLHISHGDSW